MDNQAKESKTGNRLFAGMAASVSRKTGKRESEGEVMGYTYLKVESVEELIEQHIKPFRGGLYSLEVIDREMTDEGLWILRKRTDSAGEAKVSIYLMLFQKDDEGWWGYKKVSEDEEPFYYKCPMRFFDKTTSRNNEWRRKLYRMHFNRLLTALRAIEYERGIAPVHQVIIKDEGSESGGHAEIILMDVTIVDEALEEVKDLLEKDE